MVALKDHEATPAGLTTLAQGSQDLARFEREHLSQAAAQCLEREAVVAGIAHEENHLAIGVVADLQAEAPLERLDVSNVGLSFDEDPPGYGPDPANDGIPRSEVPGNRKRHFGPPWESWMQSHAEPLKQRELGPIPNGIPGRITAQRELEPDNLTERADKVEPQRGDQTAFEPPDRGVRPANRTSHSPLAETCGNPGFACLSAEAMRCFAGAASTPIRRSFPGWHTDIFSTDHSLALTGGLGRPGVPSRRQTAPALSRTGDRRSRGTSLVPIGGRDLDPDRSPIPPSSLGALDAPSRAAQAR